MLDCKYKQKLVCIEDQKKSLLKEVYDDPNMSKIEKLMFLNDHNLCTIYNSILIPSDTLFLEEYNQFENYLKERYPDRQYFNIDERWHEDVHKYQEINFAYMAEGLQEDLDEGITETLFFTSGNLDDKCYISTQKVIDILYEYAFKNLVIGYKFDW